MIKCLLCDSELRVVNNLHLVPVHNITTDTYREMFPDAETWSEESKQQISDTLFETMSDGEVPRRISESLAGHEVSEETRQRISDSSFGKTMSEEARQQMSESAQVRWSSEEARQQQSESLTGNKNAAGHEVSEEARQLISEGASRTMRENWKDPEFAKRVSESWNRKPNIPELQLQSILDKHSPGEWKYVGDGSFWIEGRNPDFINTNSKKQVIEMFGVYWHDPELFPNRPTEEELIAHYKQYGFDCLVFWEYDAWDEEEVVSRLMGGDVWL